MLFFDPLYIAMLAPVLLLTVWAQFKVKGNFKKFSRVRASSGVTGAEAARRMLDNAGMRSVGIEQVSGFLSDHYDPSKKVLRLSPDVYGGRSLSALGVACHEAGHAIQDAKHYFPLKLRNGIVPLASVGSNLSMLFLMGGFLLAYMGAGPLGQWAILAGIGLFSLTVIFQIVNLPVEFDASKRAKAMLPQLGLISGRQEENGVQKVLNAAALTYVAATLTAIVTLLYFIMRFAGGSRE
ncbi:MAG: zinc metallopeptidase [Sumerlaeia bacterium]